MEPSDILLKLSTVLDSSNLGELVTSLHQDQTIWNSLCGEEFITLFAEAIEGDSTKWTPGAIALFGVNQLNLIDTFSKEPLQPLPADIRQQASIAFQNALKSSSSIMTLQESVLLSIALRERKRLTNSWSGLIHEIVNSSSGHVFHTSVWQTAFIILFSLFVQDRLLFDEFISSEQVLTSQEYFPFITKIILSQPTRREEKFSQIKDLLQHENITQQVVWLKIIKTLHPSLARELAADISSGYTSQDAASNSNPYGGFLQDIAQKFRNTDPLSEEIYDPDFTLIDSWLSLYDIANDQQQYTRLLDYKDLLLRNLRSKIDARRIRNSIGLDASGQSEQWAALTAQLPDSPIAKAEYLLSSDSNKNASFITDQELEPSNDGLVLLARSRMALDQGNREKSQEYLEQAILSTRLLNGNSAEVGRYSRIIQGLGFSDIAKKYLLHILQSNPLFPEIHTLIANIELQQGNCEAAINNAKTALLFSPDDLSTRRILATAYHNNGQLEDSLAEWGSVINSNHSDHNAACSDSVNYAFTAIKSGKPDEAIRVCEDLITKGNNNGDVLCVLADAYKEVGDDDHAIAYYNQATALAPENEKPWLALARFYSDLGDQGKAHEILLTAMNACPNSSEINAQLGDFYSSQSSYSESLPFFQKAFELNPGNAKYAMKYGSSLQITGQPTHANHILKTALQNNPDDPELLQAYANLLQATGNIKDSFEPLHRLVRLHPAEINPYIDLAEAGLEMNKAGLPVDIAELHNLLKEGLALDENNYYARLTNAELLSLMGDSKSAQSSLFSLAEDPDLPEDIRWRVNFDMGVLSSDLGQNDVALAALEEAGSLNPKNSEVQQKLAETYLASQLPKAAMEAAQTALFIAPDNANNLIWYSDFCLRLGDIPEALSSLSAAIKQQPEKTELRVRLGELQIKLNDLGASKETFNELINQNLADVNIIHHIAKIVAEAGAVDDAVEYLTIGIKQNPAGSLQLLMDLSDVEKNTGNLTKALDAIDQAIILDPDNPDLILNKADLLAFSQNYEEARKLIDGLISWESSSEQNPGNEDAGFLYLRQAFIFRKIGNHQSALSFANKASEFEKTRIQASYLAADISYNLMDFSTSDNYLRYVIDDNQESNYPLRISAKFISDLIKNESGLQDASSVSDLSDIPSRWFLWQTAILLSPVASIEEVQLFSELDGNSIEDIYNDLGISDFVVGQLPRIDAYNLVLSSPTLIYPIFNACLNLKLFSVADWLYSQIQNKYPNEPSVSFYLMKKITLAAETYRDYEETQIINHSPSSNSISISTMDQFSEAVLKVKLLVESDLVSYWELRGLAALDPKIENIEKLADFSSPLAGTKPILQKLAYRNDISQLTQLILEDSKNAVLAANMISKKAPEKAFELISDSLATDINDPVDLSKIAFISQKANEYQVSLESIERALEIWPNEPKWHTLAAALSKQLGDLKNALDHLHHAVDLEPENEESLLLLGENLIEQGETDQAVQYLKIASGLNGSGYKSWYLLARAYHKSGDQLQAMTNIDRALQLSPDNVESLILSAEMSLSYGQINQSINRVDSILRSNPKNTAAIVVKSKALRKAGQFNEAMQLIDFNSNKVAKPLPLLLEKADMIKERDGNKAYLSVMQTIVNDYPKDSELLCLYAQALAENGYPSEALKVTQLALKEAPNQTKMHILAGRLLRSTGQLDQSLDHISQALNIESKNVDAFLELARIYQDRRDFEKAIEVYGEAIKQQPNDYRPYFHLGLALKDAKDYRGAENMLRKAADISKDDVNVLRQLGAIIAINLVHSV